MRNDIDPAQEWLRDPAKFAVRNEMLLKKPVPHLGTRVVRLESSAGPLVLKEYRATTFGEMFKGFLRGARSWRSLKTALRLREIGVPAIEPVAAAYSSRKPWHSFLATRELKSAVAALDYVQESPRHRREVARSLARIMTSLHRAGLLHGDAHVQNFVWQRAEPPHLLMVDVDGVRECREVTLLQTVRDLARLLDYTEPGTREMNRFAIEYCRLRGGRLTPRELVLAMKAPYRERASNAAGKQVGR